MADIPAAVSIFKGNQAALAVSLLHRLLQGIPRGRNAQHPAAGRYQPFPLPFGAGCKKLARKRGGDMDLITRFIFLRIALGGHHHAGAGFFRPLNLHIGQPFLPHRLKDFEPWVGEIEMRTNGSIISGETGTAFAYSIDKLQDRGRFFISPMDQVYEGQVIGEHTRQNDITVNVTKAKQLTNMRASGSDDKTSIAPPKVFTLEEALEYIQADEYVEVTPHAMRLRKILLHEVDRKRASK